VLSALWNYHPPLKQPSSTFGYSAISGDQLPAWVAKEAGIFRRGLDVPTCLLHRRHDGGHGLDFSRHTLSQVAGSAVVNSVLSGSDSVHRGRGYHFSQLLFDGTRTSKLRNSSKEALVAISRFGSSSISLPVCFIEDRLDPGKDVTIVQLAVPGPRRRVLTGRVQATVINPPASIIAEKKGMTSWRICPSSDCLPAYYRRHDTKNIFANIADVVRRYVKSQVDAVHRIYTDKETSIKVLGNISAAKIERDILEKSL